MPTASEVLNVRWSHLPTMAAWQSLLEPLPPQVSTDMPLATATATLLEQPHRCLLVAQSDGWSLLTEEHVLQGMAMGLAPSTPVGKWPLTPAPVLMLCPALEISLEQLESLEQQSSWLVVDGDGVPCGLLPQHRRQQLAFERVFERSPDPIAIATFPEGRYLAVNHSFSQLCGYRQAQILGNTPRELGLGVSPSALRRLGVQLRRQGGLANQEMIYCTRTGERRTLLVACELIEFAGQLCVLAVGKDISDRKAMEVALSTSEERFRALFEQMEVGVCRAALDGQIVSANPGLARLLGYSCQELLTYRFQALTWEADLEADLSLYRQLLAGEIPSYSIEKRYRHRQGHPVWVHLTVCLMRDATGQPQYSIGVCHGISDRKATELALRQSEARYALATRDSSVGVWDWDLLTNAMYISPNLKRLLGHAPDAIADTLQAWLDLLHDDDRECWHRAVAAHLNGETATLELSHRMRHRDGSLRWLLARGQVRRDGDGRPMRMAGTDTDITALKQAEAALRDVHRHSQDILESITDAFFALDQQWQFTYINQRAEQLLGRSRRDLLGQTLWSAFPEVSGTRFSQEYRRAMYERVSITFEEFYGALSCWYETHVYPTQEGLAVYFQDITERKRTYDQLHRQMRREQALNRVLQAVRQSLDLETIFATAASEVAQILPLDRVAVAELYENQRWRVVAEHCTDPQQELMVGQDIPAGNNPFSERLRRLEVVCIDSPDQLADPIHRTMANPQSLPGAWLLVPLHTQGDTPWGSLSLLRHPRHGPWQPSEIELAKTVADQLAIAIHQAQTLHQARRELEERQRVEARLQEAQRIARTGSWEVDLISQQVSWSEEMFRICGLAPTDSPLSWAAQRQRVHPEDRDRWWHSLQQAATCAQAQSTEFRLYHPDGTLCHVQMIVKAHNCDSTQQVIRLVGTLTDISERKKIEQRLVHDALHDALTGAPNRTCFMQQLDAAVERAKTDPDYTFGLLFIDLDRFKVINDSLGHLAGDQLLIECTQRIQSVLRQHDRVARLGGDEFAILLPHIGSSDGVLDIAERVHQVLQAPFWLAGREIFISASIGIASNLMATAEAVDFLRDADTAMYRAKRQGRGQSALFEPTMYDEVNTQLTLESDLRRALKRQELQLVYQPLVDLHRGTLIGFEALLRWHHPRWGSVAPQTFIPLAEETGLIKPLGVWALQTACQQLQDWQQQLPMAAELTMNVNLSAKQFADANLMQQIDRILARTGIPSHNLRLEITESALIENTDIAQSLLDALRDRGIELCIDDFGTGYSSLGMIHRFPVQVLKIDRAFVSRMDVDARGAGMIEAVLAIAQTLNMAAIAEGVETLEQYRRLRSLGCACAQGYYFAQPLTAAAATDLLATSPRW